MASAIGGDLRQGSGEMIFSSLETDSRRIAPGQVFWALRGERYDGHNFAAQALEKGAAGVVVEADRIPSGLQPDRAVIISVPDTLKALGDLAAWWRHEHSVSVVAITGSVGKTTTKEMAAAILSLSETTLKNQGNFNNLVGLPLTLLQLHRTHRRVVLEMGMNRRGEIARLTEISDPDVGLITNVARAHLEGLGDIQGVARAKVELVERMSEEGRIILYGDDEVLMKAAAPFGRRIMTYGLGPSNEVRAQGVRHLGRQGLSFDIHFEGKAFPVRLDVPGRANVLNALGASAIALSFRESHERIAEGLSRFKGMHGRFTVSDLPGGATLVDDTYNANPTSLKAALESLKDLVSGNGRVIIGLGEMMELGEESERAHLEAGEMVAEVGVHLFVAMGDHAEKMLEGAVSHGLPKSRTILAASHGEMVRVIREELKGGDLLFLKGSRRMGLDRVASLLSENLAEEV